MADGTGISWSMATWNPVVGCSIISSGCRACYAMREAFRLGSNPKITKYAGLTKLVKDKPVWNDTVRLHAAHLDQPIRWTKPRLIFVNSMSDLFHESLLWAIIDKVYAVMALAHHHTFQVLTKRADIMERYCNDPETPKRIEQAIRDLSVAYGRKPPPSCFSLKWPLPNIWHGVSVENQARADEVVPALIRTTSAIRWVSAEPLLEHVDLTSFKRRNAEGFMRPLDGRFRTIDWVVAGGESAKPRDAARPMHPDWARSLRDQCAAAGVPFFFKQWGEWAPGENANFPATRTEQTADWDGEKWHFESLTPRVSEETHRDDEPDLYLIGKREAGDKLDGVQHHHWPAGFTMPAQTTPGI